MTLVVRTDYPAASICPKCLRSHKSKVTLTLHFHLQASRIAMGGDQHYIRNVQNKQSCLYFQHRMDFSKLKMGPFIALGYS